MSTGFKVKPSPLPPRVLAAKGEPVCDESAGDGAYCERPKGHVGGHLSESHHRYWQAEGAQS